MKKIVSLTVVAALALGVAACSKSDPANTEAENVALNEVAPAEDNLTDNAVAGANAVEAVNATEANSNDSAADNSSNAN